MIFASTATRKQKLSVSVPIILVLCSSSFQRRIPHLARWGMFSCAGHANISTPRLYDREQPEDFTEIPVNLEIRTAHLGTVNFQPRNSRAPHIEPESKGFTEAGLSPAPVDLLKLSVMRRLPDGLPHCGCLTALHFVDPNNPPGAGVAPPLC
jgi:hypothetical protein